MEIDGQKINKFEEELFKTINKRGDKVGN